MGAWLKVILDTCSLIWLVSAPKLLSSKAKKLIEADSTKLYLSHASVWEVLLKNRSGKLKLEGSVRMWFSEQTELWQITYIPILLEHLHRSSEIENHHNDPFDRLLIAQSICEGMAIITPDEAIQKYPVNTLW